MFRPLLSSVPATTFGAGKANNVHRPMLSHSSSMTTSRSAGSEHGSTLGPYMDTDQEQHDLIDEWKADDGCQVHEDIFMFDKLDELNEETSREKGGKYIQNDRHGFGMERSGAADPTSYDGAKSSQIGHGDMATCTRCGKFFSVMDLYGKGDYCEECTSKLGNFSADPMEQTSEKAGKEDYKIANSKTGIESEHPGTPDFADYGKEASLVHHLVNSDPLADCMKRCPPIQLMDTIDEMLLGQDMVNHVEKMRPNHVSDSLLGNNNDVLVNQSNSNDHQRTEPTSVVHDRSEDNMASCNHNLPQCLPMSDCQHNEAVSEIASGDNSHQLGSAAYPNHNAKNTEGTGISILLLQKSNSNKWPIMEGRSLAATNILCLEPYYTRDNVNMMKRSFGRDSSSAASSIDLGSSRQSDARFERHRSGKRGDFEKAQLSSTMSRQSIASVSDMSISGSSASFCPQNDTIGDTGFPVDTYESSTSRTVVSTEEHDWSCKDASSNVMMECSSAVQPIVDDDVLVDLNSSSFDRLSEVEDEIVQNHSMGRTADNDHSSSNNMFLSDTEMPSNVRESSAPEESCMPKTEEDTSTITQCCLNGNLENPSNKNCDVQMHSEAVQALNEENRLDDCCVSAISEEDVLVSGTETSIMELPNDEGSTIQIQRCFTLEEATDTILFCSSIVHDLAYKAATIALEHKQEAEPTESTRPTVTIIGKSITKEDGILKLPHKRTPNRKVKRKRLEGETTITETAEKEVAKDTSPVRSTSEITRTSDSMKPPKLESKCNCIIM